jgi:hypothetical protein
MVDAECTSFQFAQPPAEAGEELAPPDARTSAYEMVGSMICE